MVVFFQALVTRAAARARRSHALALGAAFYGAGFLVIGLSTSLAGVVVGAGIVTLGELLSIPTSVALAAELAPEESRGRYLGAYGLFLDLGHGTGQILGGAGLSVFAGRPSTFWTIVCAFCCLTGASYLYVGKLFRERKRARLAARVTPPSAG